MFLKTNKWLAQGLLKNSGQGRAEGAQSCVEMANGLSTEQYSAPSHLTAVTCHSCDYLLVLST